MKKRCRADGHTFSRAVNQPRPRRCVMCGDPEVLSPESEAAIADIAAAAQGELAIRTAIKELNEATIALRDADRQARAILEPAQARAREILEPANARYRAALEAHGQAVAPIDG